MVIELMSFCNVGREVLGAHTLPVVYFSWNEPAVYEDTTGRGFYITLGKLPDFDGQIIGLTILGGTDLTGLPSRVYPFNDNTGEQYLTS